MNGYSKMKMVGSSNTKSRSMDFSDLLSFPQTPKSTSKATQSPKTEVHGPNNQIKNHPTRKPEAEDSFAVQEEEEEEDHQEGNFGDKFGVGVRGGGGGGLYKLSRTSSVSSGSAVHTALKRALSMRRSSSVSERYCRIHDQSVTFAASPIYDEDGVELYRTRSVKKKKKKHSKSKILKACKKLFGL